MEPIYFWARGFTSRAGGVLVLEDEVRCDSRPEAQAKINRWLALNGVYAKCVVEVGDFRGDLIGFREGKSKVGFMGFTDAVHYLECAARLAKRSTCLRRRCGAVLVLDGGVIGGGFNSPPGELDSQRRCLCVKKAYNEKVTDKTCCVHAEQRAIIDALCLGGRVSLAGSTLYFVSVDKDGKRILSGQPYCTICSKLALDVGVKKWVLEHENGIYEYDAGLYNTLSYDYQG
jgi:dCMP deaminase